MNFNSLINNIGYSNKVCKGFIDKIYYTLILYKILIKSAIINFNFNFNKAPVKLILRNNNGSDTFILSEVFKEECYKLTPKFDIFKILDLGANAGFTAVYYSKIFPKAHIACIEPIPGNIYNLYKNLNYNNVNATVFKAAVSIKDGKIDMELGDKDYGHKITNNVDNKTNRNIIAVDAITVGTILQNLKWDNIDLLKIDIEGYESILLSNNNSWLSLVKIIVMEIHDGITINDIKRQVDPFGFKFIEQQKGNWFLSKVTIK